MHLGIDVSFAQGKGLPWKDIASSGVEFAIIRTGQGTRIIDGSYENHRDGALDARLWVGTYHFFEPDADPVAQARQYHRLGAFGTQLPPVLDFEALRGVAPGLALERAVTWCEETAQLWGEQPILYTYPNFWENELKGGDRLAHLRLWIAHYGVEKPWLPKAWDKAGWTLWQFDGDGGKRLPGGKDSDFVWSTLSPEDLALGAGPGCLDTPPAYPGEPGWKLCQDG